MLRPPVEKIIEVLRSKNYVIYDTPSIDWNLNIVGIRNNDLESKKFNDTLTIFHKFHGVWDINYYPITTDPSIKYLRNPINPHGCAILKEGQYKGVYAIDLHRGKYRALCQRLGPVTVYRDRDRDSTVEIIPGSEETGNFTINIHKGPRNGDFDPENTIYSAGCQVFADDRHFAEFMLKCEHGRDAFGNKFTYTLLNEKDFV